MTKEMNVFTEAVVTYYLTHVNLQDLDSSDKEIELELWELNADSLFKYLNTGKVIENHKKGIIRANYDELIGELYLGQLDVLVFTGEGSKIVEGFEVKASDFLHTIAESTPLKGDVKSGTLVHNNFTDKLINYHSGVRLT